MSAADWIAEQRRIERAAQRLGLTPDALAKNIQRLGIAWPAALTAQRRLHA